MASQSFYRKWRSQTFADVVGQAHVTRTLRNALQMGRVAHAYLLCGPRGVGKTSVARILAKAVNCLQPTEGEPCNECPMCVAITEGRALDVIEIDAASNRRIEEMRDLREKVNFAPNEAHYKVYILDEAHMLTTEASNALLKTLEEPPAHTVFVLVTTEAHRIPETIISRCQRFNFRRISSKETVSRLSMVCAQEGLAIAPEALGIIARAATGSLRDAEGLLDQLVAYCGKEISAAQAQDVLGLSGDEALRQLAGYVLDGNLSSGLQLINQLADSGADLGRFAADFVAYLRSVLLLKGGADAATLNDLAGDTLEAMKVATERITLGQLVKLIRTFGEAEQGTRGGSMPQLALELALAEAALNLEQEQRPATPAGAEHPAARPRLTADGGPRRVEPVGIDQIRQKSAVHHDGARTGTPTHAEGGTGSGDDASNGRRAGAPEPPAAPSYRDLPAPGSPDALFEMLRQRWGEAVEALGVVNKPLQALLRSCGPYEARGDRIVIGCDATFHRDKLGETQNRLLLEKTISEMLGVRVLLQFEVVPRQKRGQPPPATSDPLVKEVLSWGGRIRQVVTNTATTTADHPAEEPAKAGEEVNDEP